MGVKSTKIIPPWFLGLLPVFICGLVFLVSMAPDYSWTHDGVDGGDLIAAAATGGVAHPTGYPTYLLIASLFQKIPVGPLAWRTNLLSLVSISGAIFITYLITQHSIRGPDSWHKRAAGVIAATSLGLAPAVWGAALITEVVAFHLFLVSLILILAMLLPETKSVSYTGAVITGLSLGNHLTAIFMVPVLFGGQSLKELAAQWKAKLISLGIIVGTSALMYATLLIRANSGSPVNWGRPTDLGNLWWLVSGQLYQDNLGLINQSQLSSRLFAWGNLLVDQFGIILLAIAMLGLLWAKPSKPRLTAITLWILGSNTLFALLYSTSDSHQYLLPVYLSIAIWISWGVYKALVRLESKTTLQGVAIFAFLLLIGFRTYQWFPQQNAANDAAAMEFGRKVMADAPQDAIVLTDTDHETFTLWYFHYALHERADLIIYSGNLLQFGWYQQTVREYYDLPASIELSTDTRPFCEIFEFELSCSGGAE